jgi:hypothetical protein
MALARVLWAVSQKDEAVRVVKEALELARSDPERANGPSLDRHQHAPIIGTFA